MIKPDATYGRIEWRFTWPQMARITLTNITEDSRGGLNAEIVIDVSAPPKPGRVYGPAKLNLLAARTIKSVASDCNDRVPSMDWQAMMLQTVELATRRWREGDPLTPLANINDPGKPRFLLQPFLEHDGTTVVFAPGGTGKSLFGLTIALAVATDIVPETLFDGKATDAGPVAYLDWESDGITQRRRLQRICKGFGHPGNQLPTNLLYRREMAPLRSSSDRLANMFEREGIRLAVIDSIGLARGGAPESAEETIRLFQAIRTLNIPVLAIDHVAKASFKEKSGDRTAFGSVYTTNAARMTWSMTARRDTNSGTLVLTLRCTKVNNGTRPDDRHLHIDFTPNSIDIREWSDRPTRPQTQTDIIREAIEMSDGRQANYTQIAELTGIDRAAIRSVISRNHNVFRKAGGHLWGLAEDALPNPMEQHT